MGSKRDSGEERSDRRKQEKEQIMEGWAFPEDTLGSIHHFYRGGLGRANVWCTRLDATTNWAVATAGALISVTFSSAQISHSILMAEIPVVALFLFVEARRFRKYDLYRSKVRLIEQNYDSTLFSSEAGERVDDWRELLAGSLHDPIFQLRFREAVASRLKRTCVWLMLVISGVWGLKLLVHPTGRTLVAGRPAGRYRRFHPVLVELADMGWPLGCHPVTDILDPGFDGTQRRPSNRGRQSLGYLVRPLHGVRQ